jgi:predicted esterase
MTTHVHVLSVENFPHHNTPICPRSSGFSAPATDRPACTFVREANRPPYPIPLGGKERNDWLPQGLPCKQDDVERPVVVEARHVHRITVIMLHGIGDSGKGLVSIADAIDLAHAKWIFPNAPVLPLTAKLGKPTPAWSDVSFFSLEGPDDEQGTMETKDMIHRLIAEEVRRGIPPHQIFIGGFSQGGAMACVAALTHKQPLAGCFVLSGYITMNRTLPFLLTEGGRMTPFFQAHPPTHDARMHARSQTIHKNLHTPLPLLCTIQYLASQETRDTCQVYWRNLAFIRLFHCCCCFLLSYLVT